MLHRSNTWPVVVHLKNNGRAATKLDTNSNENNGTQKDSALPAQVLPNPLTEPRKTTTLYRHYYVEGGWGWLIVAASVLVHILSHGLQLSSVVILGPAANKFKARITDSGKAIDVCASVIRVKPQLLHLFMIVLKNL